MIAKHIENLENYFKGKKVVIAYSGGLDSTVLLEFVLENASDVLAINIKSNLVPANEQDFAVQYLKLRDVRFRIINVNPLNHPKVVSNDFQRCYYCKKLIFETIITETKSFDPDIIVEGSNLTDLSDYRPGLKAIKELKINSPFIELKISKNEIKGLAEILSLSVAKKPATTCLATRIPYGQEITKDRLKRVETAEQIIREIIPISVLRVRDHEDIARIEIQQEDVTKFLEDTVRNSIKESLKRLGFSYITLDLEGYTQGSMNINIEGEKNN